ncbi:MAG: hypothetical protein F6K11_37020 [Leptolyngbya sp. SIO3F4]|nr:hypothetical protein [Leptolyngbya sp. SIO3F4]
MYSLETFTKADLYKCSVALRNLEYGAKTMEDTANRIVRYIYDNFLDPRTGEQQATLVRFFKTHPYRDLTPRLQKEAQSIVQDRYISPATKCLTLLATAGDESQWNDRRQSKGHQAIPLIDEDFVRRAPMILQLIQQFGLDVSAVIETNPALITRSPHKAFNVFHIPTALNSPYIPGQREFVIPYRVQSVLGFGGMLPSNDLFAVIMFSKAFVPVETANRFKFISAYVRVAVESFNRDNILVPEAVQR